jgi:hypothetical protein
MENAIVHMGSSSRPSPSGGGGPWHGACTQCAWRLAGGHRARCSAELVGIPVAQNLYQRWENNS